MYVCERGHVFGETGEVKQCVYCNVSTSFTMLCMVPLGSCARSPPSYNASSLGSCVHDPATACVHVVYNAVHGPSGVVLARHRRRTTPTQLPRGTMHSIVHVVSNASMVPRELCPLGIELW